MKPEDFEELLANCADEPIRFPGAIQPHLSARGWKSLSRGSNSSTSTS